MRPRVGKCKHGGCWTEKPELVAAVKSAKRTQLYRRERRNLRGPVPIDVWTQENGMRFVVFQVRNPAGWESMLTFAITQEGDVAQEARIDVEIDNDAWRATNRGAEVAAPALIAVENAT